MNVLPEIDNIKTLVKDYDLIPLKTEILADMITPVQLLNSIKQDGPCFLLESAENGKEVGRYSFLASNPSAEIIVKDGISKIISNGNELSDDMDPFDYIQDYLDCHRSPDFSDFPRFTGGLVGYFGYDAVRYIEKKLTNPPADALHLPDIHLLSFNEVICFDHLRHRLILISNMPTNGDINENYKLACKRINSLAKKIEAIPSLKQDQYNASPGEMLIQPLIAKDDYFSIIEKAKDYIISGDIFQVVPSQRFIIDNTPDAFSVYRMLRADNPSPYMYYFNFDNCQIAGTSPEMLASVEGTKARTKPIAGTIRRGRNAQEDEILEEILLSDEKENAEHTMLTDLGRNDLGKVCEFGSVKVDSFMKVEHYSSVMHLVSDVSGIVCSDKSNIDVLKAVLPAGTLSGAPKVRAMEIIDELEPVRRGIYGGTIGFLGWNGNMNTCITIRTALFKDNRAYVQAGGGVVYDSNPEAEYEELSNKASAVINAIKKAGENR